MGIGVGRHLGDLGRLGLGEPCVGDDARYRGVGPLERHLGKTAEKSLGAARERAPVLGPHPRCGLAGFGVSDVAAGVDGGDGTAEELPRALHVLPEARLHRPVGAGELADRASGARTDVPPGERRGSAVERRGAGVAPVSGRRAHAGVAACEVEQARARDDRHARDADVEADPTPLELLGDAARGGEAEGAAAREHDRVEHLDGLLGAQEVGLARGGRPAADVDAAHGAVGADDDRAAGSGLRVGGVCGKDAGYLRDAHDVLLARHGALPI